MSHLIVKPPDDGLPVAWHQDNTYWHSVQGTDVATVWLAIDDADESNGCMNVIPRSHDGYATKTVTVDAEQHWVPVYLVRGDMGDQNAAYVDLR